MEHTQLCPECNLAKCKGPGKLRHFGNWTDLSSHASEDQLVEWVNHYADMIKARDSSGKRYRIKQQVLANVAKKYLDLDELERVNQLAEERAEER